MSNPRMFMARLLGGTKMFHTDSPSLLPHCNLGSFQLGNGENFKANALFPSLIFYQVGIWGLGRGRKVHLIEVKALQCHHFMLLVTNMKSNLSWCQQCRGSITHCLLFVFYQGLWLFIIQEQAGSKRLSINLGHRHLETLAWSCAWMCKVEDAALVG